MCYRHIPSLQEFIFVPQRESALRHERYLQSCLSVIFFYAVDHQERDDRNVLIHQGMHPIPNTPDTASSSRHIPAPWSLRTALSETERESWRGFAAVRDAKMVIAERLESFILGGLKGGFLCRRMNLRSTLWILGVMNRKR